MSVAMLAANVGDAKPFPWWLDWSGRTVAIVACGPSAKKAGVSQLRGRVPVLAIKEAAVDLCPWADVVYGCDAPWWKYRLGMPGFSGLKLTWASDIPPQYPDVRLISIGKRPSPGLNENPYADRILVEQMGVIGGGGNSGFQALNIAVQFGAARILLVGFDAHADGGEHYYGRNNWAMANNPMESHFQDWRRAFDNAAADLKRLGISVVNCSTTSTLGGFDRMTIEQALERWRL